MDYSHGEAHLNINAEATWPQLSHAPHSDSQIYTSSRRSHTSPDPRYTVDDYSQDAMAWTQHQADFHSQAPSLQFAHEDEADLDLFYSHSSLGSPALDQASFLSVSPHPTPGESGSNQTSYFQSQNAHSPAGSDEPRSVSTAARKKERAQHNVVEHRYREKLNAQISQLRDKVPALVEASRSKRAGKEPAKAGKSAVLVKAGEYIDKLENENARLRKRNESLERLVQRLVHGRSSGEAYDISDLNIS